MGAPALYSSSQTISNGKGTDTLSKSMDRCLQSKFAFLPGCSGLYCGTGNSGSSFLPRCRVIKLHNGEHKAGGGAVRGTCATNGSGLPSFLFAG